MKKRLLLVLLALMGGAIAVPVLADAESVPPQSQTVPGHLGVAIEPVPPALWAQLPDSIPHEQGVMVTQVAPDSPAAKAGIRPYDILLSYGDQRLFSPEQLAKLVRSDTPGRQVSLKLVRNGQIESVTVTVAKASAPVAESWPERRNWMAEPHHHPRLGVPLGRQRPEASFWEEFDALSLEKLDDGRYKASIDYLAKDGRTRHFEYEGSRQEIQRQIMQEKDMTPTERRHLLAALKLEDQWPGPPTFMPPFDRAPFGPPPGFDWPPGL